MRWNQLRCDWLRDAVARLIGVALLVFALAPASLHAQEQETLAPIMVTAQRVSQDVQSVPLTVNVLTADEIQDAGIESASQINGLLPNVSWVDYGGSLRNAITIRGIASGYTNTGIDPGVGVYVDDVYMSDGIGFNQSLLDVSRIEVLKGPQGTLFGRNTIAGVVSIHTVTPSTDKAYIQGSVTGGDYGLFDGRGVVNVPLSGDSALKLSGIYRVLDGYDFDVVTNKRVNGEGHYGGRAQYYYRPDASFDLLATAYYFRDSAPQDLPRCGFSEIAGICPLGGAHVLAANPPNTSQRNMWGSSVEMNWTPGDWGKLTSITSFQHLDALESQDQDAVTLDLTRSGFSVPHDDTVTQELRLTTPQELRARGIAGVFYLNEDKESNTPQVYTPLLIELANGPTNGGYGIPGNADLLTLNTQRTGSVAVFGQGSFDITPRLIAQAGLRYTWDSKSFDFAQTTSGTNVCFGVGAPEAVNNCPFPLFRGSHSWGALSGTTSLSYQVTRSELAYVRFSRGYKSGGWNGNQLSPGTNPTVPFGPEFLNMIEVGEKFESDDHRLILNAALFHNEYSNMQLDYENPTTFVQYVANAGAAESEGLELEATSVLFEGMVLDGNVGLEDTKITKVAASPALSDLLDKQFPFAPRANASLTATYTHSMWAGIDGSASLTTAWRSDEFIDNQSTVKSKGYADLGVRIGISTEDGRWGAYVSGHNLTNVTREVFSLGNAPWASNVGVYNAPRTVEFEVEFKN